MRVCLALCLLLIVGACDREITINLPTEPTQKEEPKVITSKIEFRVVGNASSVRIRYSTPADGLIQTVTSLPFFAAFNTTESLLFLSLDVTPLAFPLSVTIPFLSAQVFVNGNLFREATSSDFFSTTLSVTGTWRR